MKLHELKNLIREEVRKAINESTNLMTMEDALAANPTYSIIAIRDKFKGDKKDIIISKANRDKLATRGYTPIGVGKAFNAYGVSVEDINVRIKLVQNNPAYKISDKDVAAWQKDPVNTYLTTGINYGQVDSSQPSDRELGYLGTMGGRLNKLTPLYMSNNGMNITGADNGKLIGFISGITQKSLIPVE
jgi:hypothetical protein